MSAPLGAQEAQESVVTLTPLELATVLGWTFGSAVVTALLTLLALRLSRNWLSRAMNRRNVDRSTRILVLRMANVAIVVTGAVTILGILGVPPATIVTIVGAVSLAFSLAMQDILKNFFSGIYLLLERPFHVGDTVKVKDQEGVVEHVGVRTTALRTKQNVQVLVPNAVVFAEVVSNTTHALPEPPREETPPAEPTAKPA